MVTTRRNLIRHVFIAVVRENLPDAHPVLRQRPRLVAADHRRRAQRFDGRQVADQRVASRHALRGHGQRKRDGGQQAFRHIGDDDADGEHEVGPERQAEKSTQREEDDTQRRGEDGDQARQARNFDLQVRCRLVGRLREVGDLSELGRHSGGEDDRAPLARDQRGSGQKYVPGFKRRQVIRVLDAVVCVARFRHRLAGNGRSVDADAGRGNQAAIRGHVVAGLEQDDVTGHQFLAGQGHQLPTTHDLDRLWQQLAQGVDRAFSAVLLPIGETAVDQDDGDDRHAKLPHPFPATLRFGVEREAGGDPQDDREEMREFPHEAPPLRLGADFFDMVRPVFAEAARRFSRCQPVFGGAETLERLGDG